MVSLSCRTSFAKRQRVPQESQFQRLYELGLIDFVSVRWQSQEMVLRWRIPLSTAALQFYLPIFISGAINLQVAHAHQISHHKKCIPLFNHRTLP